MTCPEICPVCVILVTDANKGIQCDGPCNRWFHASCAGISQTEYNKLAKNDNQNWSCGRDDCINGSKQPLNILLRQLSLFNERITSLAGKIDTLTPLPAKIDQIIEQVDSLTKNLASLDKRVSDNEEKIVILEKSIKDIPKTNTNDIEGVVAEVNERARRASNVMIYGLPESNSPDIKFTKFCLIYQHIASSIL
ncbi:hypothetical protein J6590_056581 [Homalodisca vitripennis]|nr:hypothetical protein J6590_056581 [Homalodisca vitripennis]